LWKLITILLINRVGCYIMITSQWPKARDTRFNFFLHQKNGFQQSLRLLEIEANKIIVRYLVLLIFFSYKLLKILGVIKVW